MAASAAEQAGFDAAREVAQAQRIEELENKLKESDEAKTAELEKAQALLRDSYKENGRLETLKNVAQERCEEALAALGAEVRAHRKSRARHAEAEKQLGSQLEAARREVEMLRRVAPAQPMPERRQVVQRTAHVVGQAGSIRPPVQQSARRNYDWSRVFGVGDTVTIKSDVAVHGGRSGKIDKYNGAWIWVLLDGDTKVTKFRGQHFQGAPPFIETRSRWTQGRAATGGEALDDVNELNSGVAAAPTSDTVSREALVPAVAPEGVVRDIVGPAEAIGSEDEKKDDDVGPRELRVRKKTPVYEGLDDANEGDDDDASVGEDDDDDPDSLLGEKDVVEDEGEGEDELSPQTEGGSSVRPRAAAWPVAHAGRSTGTEPLLLDIGSPTGVDIGAAGGVLSRNLEAPASAKLLRVGPSLRRAVAAGWSPERGERFWDLDLDVLKNLMLSATLSDDDRAVAQHVWLLRAVDFGQGLPEVYQPKQIDMQKVRFAIQCGSKGEDLAVARPCHVKVLTFLLEYPVEDVRANTGANLMGGKPLPNGIKSVRFFENRHCGAGHSVPPDAYFKYWLPPWVDEEVAQGWGSQGRNV